MQWALGNRHPPRNVILSEFRRAKDLGKAKPSPMVRTPQVVLNRHATAACTVQRSHRTSRRVLVAGAGHARP